MREKRARPFLGRALSHLVAFRAVPQQRANTVNNSEVRALDKSTEPRRELLDDLVLANDIPSQTFTVSNSCVETTRYLLTSSIELVDSVTGSVVIHKQGLKLRLCVFKIFLSFCNSARDESPDFLDITILLFSPDYWDACLYNTFNILSMCYIPHYSLLTRLIFE